MSTLSLDRRMLLWGVVVAGLLTAAPALATWAQAQSSVTPIEFGSGAALVLAGAAIVVLAGVLLFLGPAVARRAYLAVVLGFVLAAVPWGLAVNQVADATRDMGYVTWTVAPFLSALGLLLGLGAGLLLLLGPSPAAAPAAGQTGAVRAPDPAS